MAIIGNFTRSENGYIGSIKTMAVRVRAKITPAIKEHDRAPDFRVFAGAMRVRCRLEKNLDCWPRVSLSQARRSELPVPVFATLVDTEDDGFVLIWSRREVE